MLAPESSMFQNTPLGSNSAAGIWKAEMQKESAICSTGVNSDLDRGCIGRSAASIVCQPFNVRTGTENVLSYPLIEECAKC